MARAAVAGRSRFSGTSRARVTAAISRICSGEAFCRGGVMPNNSIPLLALASIVCKSGLPGIPSRPGMEPEHTGSCWLPCRWVAVWPSLSGPWPLPEATAGACAARSKRLHPPRVLTFGAAAFIALPPGWLMPGQAGAEQRAAPAMQAATIWVACRSRDGPVPSVCRWYAVSSVE